LSSGAGVTFIAYVRDDRGVSMVLAFMALIMSKRLSAMTAR
jgi:hypothetical protein